MASGTRRVRVTLYRRGEGASAEPPEGEPTPRRPPRVAGPGALRTASSTLDARLESFSRFRCVDRFARGDRRAVPRRSGLAPRLAFSRFVYTHFLQLCRLTKATLHWSPRASPCACLFDRHTSDPHAPSARGLAHVCFTKLCAFALAQLAPSRPYHRVSAMSVVSSQRGASSMAAPILSLA